MQAGTGRNESEPLPGAIPGGPVRSSLPAEELARRRRADTERKARRRPKRSDAERVVKGGTMAIFGYSTRRSMKTSFNGNKTLPYK